MIWLIGASLAQDADYSRDSCAEETNLEELRVAYREGEEAFSNLDIDGLTGASDDAEGALPCLNEPIDPLDASAYHRLMGLNAFAAQDADTMQGEFHAARKLEPGYQVPEEVAPPGHPMIEAYNKAHIADEGELQVPFPPEGGYVTVGGISGAPRPAGSPVIIQVFDAEGDLKHTAHYTPGEPMPEWGPSPIEAGPPVALIAAAGGAAILAGGLYGAAWTKNKDFWDESTPDGDLVGLQAQTNALAYSAAGAAAISVGLGTVVVLTW